MPNPDSETLFRFFTEIGIIAQLSRALFEARLPPGFVLAQFTVLNHLIRVKDGQTPLQLAQAFQVAKTSMSHTLMVLEREGLVRMRSNPEDGRSKGVWITEKGRKFRTDAIAAVVPDLTRLTRDLDSEELNSALSTLGELRRIMDRDRSG